MRENIVEGIALQVKVYLDRNGASEIEPISKNVACILMRIYWESQ